MKFVYYIWAISLIFWCQNIPFEERFIPQSVGDRALDFANNKLSISEMIGKYKAFGEHCFSSAGGFSENQAQTIVMRLSDTLHEISGGGLFAIEILRLDALDREIAMRGKKDAVAQEYADILSSIEELGRFQESIWPSMSMKKGTFAVRCLTLTIQT